MRQRGGGGLVLYIYHSLTAESLIYIVFFLSNVIFNSVRSVGDRTALQPSGIETLTPREMPDQYIIVSSMMGLESTIYLSLDQ